MCQEEMQVSLSVNKQNTVVISELFLIFKLSNDIL